MGIKKEICQYADTCNGFVDFEPGSLTADGKKTHVTMCPAGLPGGCGGLLMPDLEIGNKKNMRPRQIRDRFGIVRPSFSNVQGPSSFEK